MIRTRALLIAVTTMLGACDDGVQPLGPRLSIVSGDGITDTVETAPAQPLVVRVSDQLGLPIPGVAVTFAGGAGLFPRYHTIAGPYADTTDQHGLATATVYLGTVAGQDTVTVNAPTLGLEAFALYTVLPGNPTGVAVDPPDTAVYVNGTIQLRGSIVDRRQNSRGGTLAYETTSPAVQLSGATARGVAIGRATIVGASGVWRDTAWVSVVPPGAAVAVLPHFATGDTQRVVFFNFDGTGFRSFDVPYFATPRPDWAPAGDVIVMEDPGEYPGFNPRLMLADASGPKRRLVPDTVGLTWESYPRYSADGSWIYFTGGTTTIRSATWRIHPDGTGVERVSPQVDTYYGDFQPSPSPDGSRVAYTRNAVCCYDLLVYVLDTRTGTIDSLQHADGTPTPGYMPRWSPVADVIAYAAHKVGEPQQYASIIWLIDPDGANPRPASDTTHLYLPEMDWSPDGRWLIARSYDEPLLHLIDTQTALRLPLAFTKLLRQPAWRRDNLP
jgi:hypothetical protein